MSEEGTASGVVLSVGRAYSAVEAAEILNMDVRTFNKRVSEGMISPMWHIGERRFSGFLIARLLGWPLSENVEDYLPGGRMDMSPPGYRCVLGEIYPPALRSDIGTRSGDDMARLRD